jgi:hypothetical protein
MGWLDKPENNSWLNKQCISHDLYLCDLSKQGFSGKLEAKKEKWVNCLPDKKDAPVKSLSAFLTAAGKSGTIDLRIEKQMGKDAAIEKKQTIASDMATSLKPSCRCMQVRLTHACA